VQALAGDVADQQPGVHAVEDPAQRGPGGRAGHPAQAERCIQGRPPDDPQREVQAEHRHRRVQPNEDDGDAQQHPPVVTQRARGGQRERYPGHDKPDHQGDGHADQAGRAAAFLRDAVVLRQADLGRDRPYAPGDVLAQLPKAHHPDGGRHRERRAQVGEQGAPGQHHAAERRDDRERCAGDVIGGQLPQRGSHLRPLRHQSVAGEAERDGEKPGPEPGARAESAQHAASVPTRDAHGAACGRAVAGIVCSMALKSLAILLASGQAGRSEQLVHLS
jgi:hypothetical protein